MALISKDSLAFAQDSIFSEPHKSVVGSVVFVSVSSTDKNGIPTETFGTGFVITGAGHILTAYHLLEKPLENGHQLDINVQIGGRDMPSVAAEILAKMVDRDSVLLKVPTPVIPYKSVCLGNKPVQSTFADQLYSFGFPKGVKHYFGSGNLTTYDGPKGMYGFSIATSDGQSGSPVYLSNARVVGMVTGKNSGAGFSGQHFFLPINQIWSFISNYSIDTTCQPNRSNSLDKVGYIKLVQTELDEHNCSPGIVDGIWGKHSSRAGILFSNLTSGTCNNIHDLLEIPQNSVNFEKMLLENLKTLEACTKPACGPPLLSDWIRDISTGCRVYHKAANLNGVVRWSGACNSTGSATGQGQATFKLSNTSSETWQVTMKDGKAEGFGKRVFQSGSYFEGSFLNGQEIEGEYYDKVGTLKYEGQFSNGLKNGIGIGYYRNGQYSGSFKDGKRHGSGTYIATEGWKYKGEFFNGKMTGDGIRTQSNGIEVIGSWWNGEEHGRMQLRFPGGKLGGFYCMYKGSDAKC